MKSRVSGTYFFAVLVLAVVAYAYFISYKGKQTQEIEKAEATRLIGWKPVDVVSVEVRSIHQFLLLRGDADHWTTSWKPTAAAGANPSVSETSPALKDEGDAMAINGFVSSILEVKSEEVVAEGKDINFELFGFADGARTVILKNKAGEERKLTFGTQTGIASKRFARLGEEEKVHLVDSALWTQLERKVADFRDKSLFQGVAGDVQRFHLVNGAAKNKGTVIIEKKPEKKPEKKSEKKTENKPENKSENKWQLAGQSETKLDDASVDLFLQSLHEAHAAEAVDKDKVKQAATYGLQSPLYTVELTMVGGKTAKIEVGGPVSVKPDGTRAEGKAIYNYARVSDRAPIYSVGANVTEVLTKNVMDFRDRSAPFQFDSNLVRSILVKTSLIDLKLKKGADNIWTEDGSLHRPIDQQQVNILFSSMKMQHAVLYSGTQVPAGMTQVRGHYAFLGEGDKIIFDLKWANADKMNQAPALSSNSNEYFTVDASIINTLPSKNLIQSPVTTTTLNPHVSQPAGPGSAAGAAP